MLDLVGSLALVERRSTRRYVVGSFDKICENVLFFDSNGTAVRCFQNCCVSLGWMPYA